MVEWGGQKNASDESRFWKLKNEGKGKYSEASWIIVFLEGLRNPEELCSNYQKDNQLGIWNQLGILLTRLV